ncbi:MAG: gamma-glutamyl-gamma-aminobutyrate hydrolase family protein [Pseudomonadota bacterium]
MATAVKSPSGKVVVAITGPARRAIMPRLLVSVAVRLYGATPLQLRPGDRFDHHGFDAAIVTGGHDIDPVLYAAKPEVVPRHDPQRDELESRVIDLALEHSKPLLGICRGAQLLNIRRGGSLFQELKNMRRETSNRWTILPLKTLLVNKASHLATLLACSRCRINSLHNQGIDRIGDGLRVSGRDLDDIVQAVEDPSARFLVGVQWHPEFLLYQRRQRSLFRALVQASRETLNQASSRCNDTT